MPAPRRANCGACSNTCAAIPTRCSAAAVAKPPIPAPMIATDSFVIEVCPTLDCRHDLLEAGDRVRSIGLLEQGDLLGEELQSDGGQSILEMLELRGADNGCRDDRLRQQPCQRYLAAGQSARPGDLGHTL